jgi:hypothetical protein
MATEININENNIDLTALGNNSGGGGGGGEDMPMIDNGEMFMPEIVPQKISYGDVEQRRQYMSLKHQIINYKNSSFGRDGILEEYAEDIAQIHYKTIEECETLLQDIKYTVGAANSMKFTGEMFCKSLYGAELAISRSGLMDLNGLTNSVMATPSMDKYMEELALDYQTFTYTRPQYKVGLIVLMKAMTINEMNEERKKMKAKLGGGISDDVKNEFNDL